MKKLFFVLVPCLFISVFVLSMSSNNDRNKASLPPQCVKFFSVCPEGYSGGWECKQGFVTITTPLCTERECGQINPCEPNS